MIVNVILKYRKYECAQLPCHVDETVGTLRLVTAVVAALTVDIW